VLKGTVRLTVNGERLNYVSFRIMAIKCLQAEWMVVKANSFSDLLLDSDFQQIRDFLKLYKNVCFIINFVR
jgi:hypothetical protein